MGRRALWHIVEHSLSVSNHWGIDDDEMTRTKEKNEDRIMTAENDNKHTQDIQEKMKTQLGKEFLL